MDNQDTNDVFKGYLKEKKSLSEKIKQPKFWAILIVILVGIFLALQFYLSSVRSLGTEELKNSIELLDVNTQWVNKDVTPYGVTIVPSITFRVKNTGTKPLKYVKFIGIFLYEENDKEFTDGFNMEFKEALKPGETSEEILIKAFNGYKASSKEAFFENRSGWKKIKVKVFAGTSSTPALLGVFSVKQEIEGIESAEFIEKQAGDSEKRFATEELRRSIQILRQDSHWRYKQISGDEIVIVPAIRFKVKNVGDSPLRYVSFKGNFISESTEKPFSQGIRIALKDPLGPGKTSEEIMLEAEYGYSVSSMKALEENKSLIEKIKVRMFAKVKESDDVLLGIFPIEGRIKAEEE